MNFNRWDFAWDMNRDGAVTISDVWLWTQWIFFLPGDGLITLMVHATPSIANFFEVSYSSFGGAGSGVISGVIWLFTWLYYSK